MFCCNPSFAQPAENSVATQNRSQKKKKIESTQSFYVSCPLLQPKKEKTPCLSNYLSHGNIFLVGSKAPPDEEPSKARLR